MLVYAQALRESGKLIHEHHVARHHRCFLGEFSLREAHDDEVKRTTNTARLTMPSPQLLQRVLAKHLGDDLVAVQRALSSLIGKALMPPLYDAGMIYLVDSVATVTGFERQSGEPSRPASFLQSWKLRFPTMDELAKIADGTDRSLHFSVERAGGFSLQKA